MPNILMRIWNVLRGRTHEWVDRLERPEDQLKLFLSEVNRQVQDLQRSVAGAIADEKRLQKEIEALTTRSEEWESRAALALQDGNEELARTALARQEECESEAAGLHQSWETQKRATARLRESLKLARSRMAEAGRRYNLLLAQYKSAQTKKRIQETLSDVSDDSPMAMMEALEDRIRRVEAEAEAQLALGTDVVEGDIEAQFQKLEQGRKGEDRLRRLRARLEDEGRLGPGGSERIDALKRQLDG
jgi:phage shock protein A